MSKVAAAVGVTQSVPASRQIRQLEEEPGVQLFYRHGRGIRMIEEGYAFQASIVPLLQELSQIASDLRDAANVPPGEITFGMPLSMSAAIGAEIVSVFFEHYPQVRLHLVDGLSGFVNEWLCGRPNRHGGHH